MVDARDAGIEAMAATGAAVRKAQAAATVPGGPCRWRGLGGTMAGPASIAGAPAMLLTGPDQRLLRLALEEVYDPTSLQMMMLGRLDRKLHNYAMGQDFEEVLFRVIDKINREGCIADFVAAALAERPGPKLAEFAGRMKVAAGEPILPFDGETARALEGIVNRRSSFQDVGRFLERLRELGDWVCRVIVGDCNGTGVLVAPDVVMTNCHVVLPLLQGARPAEAVCVFDYKRLGQLKVDPGRRVAIAATAPLVRRWSEADLTIPVGRPDAAELDYALIRLQEPVGERPAGAAGSDKPRGWLELRTPTRALAVRDPVFILQHPQPEGATQLPMQLSIGTTLACSWAELRTRYDASTLPGSSGSPVFDADLECVGLHHAGDPTWAPRYNQAIPIAAIVADLTTRAGELADREIARFWT
jgi:hypothetical protein